VRELAAVLYAHFGVSMRGISKIFKVSTQAVLKWMRAASECIQEPKKSAAEIVHVDEMWHFVNGKKTKFGSGERFAGYHAALSDGISVIVLTKV
jgi:transposase